MLIYGYLLWVLCDYLALLATLFLLYAKRKNLATMEIRKFTENHRLVAQWSKPYMVSVYIFGSAYISAWHMFGGPTRPAEYTFSLLIWPAKCTLQSITPSRRISPPPKMEGQQ